MLATLNVLRPSRVLVVVTKFALWCALSALQASAADTTLDTLLKSVENRYNHAQSLKLDFTETYRAQKRAEQVESGVLFLRKPGRMRWDYSSPAGKVFVTDGKDVYLYTPDSNRVEHTKVKESEDMRVPLAFLLGKLNFYKEFRKFDLRTDGADTWIDAEPNPRNLPYTQIAFLVAPDARIRQLRVVGQDRSVLDFTFEQERLNVPINSKLFAFRPPAGAEVIEGDQ